MSRSLAGDRVGILDYDPHSETWTERDSDVHTACTANYSILSKHDSTLKTLEMLDDVIQHDGRHVNLVTINGESPAPAIVVPLGAEVIMRVKNRLRTEAVTVHLHGVDKDHMWFTDGVAFVQQCPIPPGSSHTYRFIADTPGTHWYHGHLMNDRADGLLGGFVIKSPDETVPIVDGERRTTLGDYILFRFVNGGVSQGIMVWLEDHDMYVVAGDGAEVKPVKVDAVAIFPGERYDILVKGLENPAKKYYRFIFETMEYFNWDWTVGQPQFALANLEYQNVQGEETDEVDFGHRKCTADSKCVVLNCPFERFPDNFNFECMSAHHLENGRTVADPEILEKKQFTSGYEEYFANMHFDNHINGWLFQSPKGIPYYHEDKLNDVARWCDPVRCDRFHAHHWDHSCDCFFHYNFTLGNIVQLTIYNMGDGGNLGTGFSHPLHMHGLHFYVMKIGYAQYNAGNSTIAGMNRDIPCTDATMRCIDLHWADPSWMMGNVEGMQKNPSFRDTVNIPTGGYVVIRFRATNPGWWFAHCHLMLHNMGGTAFSYRIGTHEQIPQPPEGYPHSCGIYEQPPLKPAQGSGCSIRTIDSMVTALLAVVTYFVTSR
ncbi:Protein F21D5.3 a [Aphelenchoides avenae]|nr:Protein F21D5.3 a [Aphelenchus avenae]